MVGDSGVGLWIPPGCAFSYMVSIGPQGFTWFQLPCQREPMQDPLGGENISNFASTAWLFVLMTALWNRLACTYSTLYILNSAG